MSQAISGDGKKPIPKSQTLDYRVRLIEETINQNKEDTNAKIALFADSLTHAIEPKEILNTQGLLLLFLSLLTISVLLGSIAAFVNNIGVAFALFMSGLGGWLIFAINYIIGLLRGYYETKNNTGNT